MTCEQTMRNIGPFEGSVAWMADQERRCAGPFAQSMHDTHVAPWQP